MQRCTAHPVAPPRSQPPPLLHLLLACPTLLRHLKLQFAHCDGQGRAATDVGEAAGSGKKGASHVGSSS